MRRILSAVFLLAAGTALGASLASTTYQPLDFTHLVSAGVELGVCPAVNPVIVIPANGAQDAKCFHTVAHFSIPSIDGTVPAKDFRVDRITKAANVPTVRALLKAEVFPAGREDSTIPLSDNVK